MRHARLVNYALYQAGWFACVLGAAWNYPVTGCALAIVLTAVHLALSTERTLETALISLAVIVGVCVEFVQLRGGTYRFMSGVVVDGWPPPWLLALWAQLATTFRYSLRSVFARGVPSLLFGAVGGPVAFLAGERLGAVTLMPPLTAGLIRLSVCWAVAMFIFHVAVRSVSRRPASTGTGVYRG